MKKEIENFYSSLNITKILCELQEILIIVADIQVK